ncbi:MAG: DUF131 domain-containing protein [Promethearchaeati archaeon SRVP18_Atabeyarchaeia-1]
MRKLGESLANLEIMISVIGAIIFSAGLTINSLQGGAGATISFGGVVLIGPFPLVFGTDRTALDRNNRRHNPDGFFINHAPCPSEGRYSPSSGRSKLRR